MRLTLRLSLIALAILLSSPAAFSQEMSIHLARGKGLFEFQSAAVHEGKSVSVWYFLPDSTTVLSPVLIVMHGVNRDAERYCDEWIDVAKRHAAVLLCPEFSLKDFPGDANYNLGNVFASMSADEQMSDPQPEDRWSFSLIDPIFDAVLASLKLQTPGYCLYGHSAGSQFVHRLIFFKPNAKIMRAVSANAGWYIMPDRSLAFPFGLRGTGCDTAMVKAALARPLTILLGENDTDPNHKNLRKTPNAMLQGTNRFERGFTFYNAGKAAAEQLHVPFNWTLVTAPGVAHSDKKMAAFAEKVLFDR